MRTRSLPSLLRWQHPTLFIVYIKRGRISLIGKMTFCGNDEKSSILLFYPQSLTINYLLLNNPVIFLVTNNLAARLSYAGIIL